MQIRMWSHMSVGRFSSAGVCMKISRCYGQRKRTGTEATAKASGPRCEVLEDAEDARVNRFGPNDLAVTGLARKRGDQQFFISIPTQYLAHTSKLTKLPEDTGYGFLNLAVRCLLHTFILCTDLADRNLRQHETTPNLLLECFHCAL